MKVVILLETEETSLSESDKELVKDAVYLSTREINARKIEFIFSRIM